MIHTYPGNRFEHFLLRGKFVSFFGQMFFMVKSRKLLSLIPESGDIDGWSRTAITNFENNHQQFSRYPLELLSYGGAQGVIQKYIRGDQNSNFVELALYDMRNIANAIRIYKKLSIRTEARWEVGGRAAEARIDDSRLFTYLIDFRKYNYFARIIVNGKDSKSLDTAKRFAKRISSKIERSFSK
jgi:hypothetical protein